MLCWLIHRCTGSPSLTFPFLGFFSYSYSQGLLSQFLSEKWACLRVLPSHPTCCCAVLRDWGCSQDTATVKKENKNNHHLFTLSRHRILPSQFFWPERWIISWGFRCSFCPAAGQCHDQGGLYIKVWRKREEKYPGYPMTPFGFQGPHFPVIWAERGGFSWKVLLFSVIGWFLDLTYLWIKAKN